MPQAARLYDPIGHSPTMNWLLQGAVAGLAIGLGAVVIVGTGGLAAVAIVGGAVAGGAGIMEVLSTLSCVPKEVTGTITGKCSGNVFTNGRPAARAHVDMTFCSKHPAVPLPIATGSGNVYINGLPAARVGDKIVCGAVITDGSGNVFIGGGSQKTDDVQPEELVPPLVHGVMFVAGFGAAVVLGGSVIAIAGLALGVAGGMAGAWAGGKLFGEGSDGQKLLLLGGGTLGGLLGGRLGANLANRFIPYASSAGTAFVKAGLPGIKALQGPATVEHAGGGGIERQVFSPDLRHVTGKSAVGRNRAIDAIIKDDFPNLKLTHKPKYSPFIRTGIAKKDAGTQIGKTNFSSRAALRNVLVHEELHHRWWAKGIYDHHPVQSRKEIRFYNTIDRYIRMRGWNE